MVPKNNRPEIFKSADRNQIKSSISAAQSLIDKLANAVQCDFEPGAKCGRYDFKGGLLELESNLDAAYSSVGFAGLDALASTEARRSIQHLFIEGQKIKMTAGFLEGLKFLGSGQLENAKTEFAAMAQAKEEAYQLNKKYPINNPPANFYYKDSLLANKIDPLFEELAGVAKSLCGEISGFNEALAGIDLLKTLDEIIAVQKPSATYSNPLFSTMSTEDFLKNARHDFEILH